VEPSESSPLASGRARTVPCAKNGAHQMGI
jgi:hypothetical protein